MSAQPSRARLMNSDRELIAEGACVLNEAAGQASLEVERTTAAVQSQHGNLLLELDSGRSLLVSDKPILLTITPPGERPTLENRRRIYRLRIIDPMAAVREHERQEQEHGHEQAQDASAVDAASKGRLAVSGMRRLSAEGWGETPAAR